MADKILSLIVPAYDMEAHLPRCIGSLGLDGWEKREALEIVIVNDGSKDKTSEIAHDFAKKYPSAIRVIDKRNGHYGSCINAALEVASGTFVKVLEPDDGYDTAAFHSLVEELSQGEANGLFADIDLWVTDYAYADTEGKVTKSVKFEYPVRTRLTFEEFQRPLKFHILLPAVTYRTAIFKRMAYSQTEGCPYTDLEWLTYPMHLVRGVVYLPLSVYRYFIGREGQTVNPRGLKKGMGTIAKLMIRMLNDYPTLLDPARPAVEAYVQKVILTQLALVYNSYLLERNPHLSREELLKLDAAARTVPAIYGRSGEATLHSRRFDFHYVREFRRARSRDSWRFVLQRLYSWVAKARG